jgi:hypothetical protein
MKILAPADGAETRLRSSWRWIPKDRFTFQPSLAATFRLFSEIRHKLEWSKAVKSSPKAATDHYSCGAYVTYKALAAARILRKDGR